MVRWQALGLAIEGQKIVEKKLETHAADTLPVLHCG